MTTSSDQLSTYEHMAIVFQCYGMAFGISKAFEMDTSHETLVGLVNHMLLVAHLQPISDFELKLFDINKLDTASNLIGDWNENC